jgi:hypothetical protein
MPQPPRNRQELEDFWCAKMQQALSRCRDATAECRKTLEERKALLAPSPDCDLAVRLAIQGETDALAEYRRVLEIFTDLVVHGKIPEESPGPG